MTGTSNNSRILKYDFLRIIAAFSVVMLHSAAQFWYTLDIKSTEWLIANSYDAVFRFGVPVFVMISGALFLDEDYKLDIKKLYTHNIFRLLVLYIVWQMLYGILDYSKYDLSKVGLKELLQEMIYGRYHLWFLPMIMGIYMLLPILKNWLEHAEKKTVEYFLILFLIFQVGSESLRALTVTDELHRILDTAKPYMVCGYLGYFIWGYYLKHYGLSDKMRKWVYALVLPAIVCNIICSYLMSQKLGVATLEVADSFSVFTFIIVTALFIWEPGRKVEDNNDKVSVRLIKEVSHNTVGIYLLHLGFIEILEGYGVHTMMLPIAVGIPLLAILCFVVCAIIAAILRRIPGIGRFLV